jgi:hypothetical protein
MKCEYIGPIHNVLKISLCWLTRSVSCKLLVCMRNVKTCDATLKPSWLSCRITSTGPVGLKGHLCYIHRECRARTLRNFYTRTSTCRRILYVSPYLYHIWRTLKTSFRRLVFQEFKLRVSSLYAACNRMQYNRSMFSHLIRVEMCILKRIRSSHFAISHPSLCRQRCNVTKLINSKKPFCTVTNSVVHISNQLIWGQMCFLLFR